MKLANIFTIIACRIINATCRCIDRGCEARVREKNYYHHNLCSIFSRNNTEDENGGEKKKKKAWRKQFFTTPAWCAFINDISFWCLGWNMLSNTYFTEHRWRSYDALLRSVWYESVRWEFIRDLMLNVQQVEGKYFNLIRWRIFFIKEFCC